MIKINDADRHIVLDHSDWDPCLNMSRRSWILLFICTISTLQNGSSGETPHKTTPGVTILPPVKPDNNPQAYPEAEKTNLPVFTMDYARIQIPFEITLWILLASFAKIGE